MLSALAVTETAANADTDITAAVRTAAIFLKIFIPCYLPYKIFLRSVYNIPKRDIYIIPLWYTLVKR